MLTEGIVALLAADPGVKAALGTRTDKTNGIFSLIAPDEVKLPYLVYLQVSSEPVEVFAGMNPVRESRIQIACYGPSYKTTKLIVAVAVKKVLDGFQGQLADPDSTIVGNIIPVSEHDEVEEAFKASVYGTILDYRIWSNNG